MVFMWRIFTIEFRYTMGKYNVILDDSYGKFSQYEIKVLLDFGFWNPLRKMLVINVSFW